MSLSRIGLSEKWQTVPLKYVLEDLSQKRRINVADNEIIREPTITSKKHTISCVSETIGATVTIKKRYKILPGDLVFSRLHTQNGAFAYSTEYFTTTGTFVPFRVVEEQIDRRFLFWALHIYVPTLTTSDSVGRETYKTRDILSLRIPLPPLDEQRRIVTQIEELTSRIEEAKALRHQTQEQLNAILPAVLYALFSDKNIEKWEKDKIAGFCEKPQYGYTEAAKQDPIGPKLLRITDIQNGKVNWDLVPYCKCSQVEKYRLMPGDILFARTGATTGKSFLVQAPPDAVFASYLIRLRVKNKITPKYLYWFFQSPKYWDQVFEEKKGSAQPNMNGKKLSNVEVMIPPLEEQYRIVDYLEKLQSQVDELQKYQAETKKELDALAQSILSKAFKGEL